MAEKFNPLDPLGILEPVRRDLATMAEGLRPGSLRLPDPLGLFRKGTIGNPIPVEFDGTLVSLKDQARNRLLERGYPAGLVDRALGWYEEWLMGMARRLAPGQPDLQKRVVQSAYAEIAPRSEQRIRGIQEAFGIPMAIPAP